MAYRNIRLHPILRLIYLFLRFLVWLGVSVFYRRRLILGREHLRFDGPAIVIANHPSTLTDVLNPALHIRQEMFFLANYGLFKHPVSNWLFRRLYCIPVKRREDVAEGETRDNDEAFRQSFQHLGKNGVLFIAPEGTSWMNRFVRPLKSGTARIALGAEAANNWQLGVKIIPAGLSYSAPHLFRSDVVVHFGAPVYARDWAGQWTKDRIGAVDALTEHLENALKTLSIHTRDEAGERALTQWETMLQNEHPLPQHPAFERSQRLVNTCLDKPELRAQTETYFSELEKSGLTDAVVAAAQKDRAPWREGLQMGGLLFTFPLFALGYAFWWLPCYLPWLLNKKLNFYIGYSSTVKMLAGLITFPLALWAAWRAAGHFLQNGWLALVVTAAAVALGLFAERYQDWWSQWRLLQNSRQAVREKAEVLKTLQQQRRAILAQLHS